MCRCQVSRAAFGARARRSAASLLHAAHTEILAGSPPRGARLPTWGARLPSEGSRPKFLGEPLRLLRLPQIAFCACHAVFGADASFPSAVLPSHHGEMSSRQWCVRPSRPPAPTRAPGGGVARPFLRGDRRRHCIGRRRSSATPSSALRCADTLPCATIPDGTHALPNRRR